MDKDERDWVEQAVQLCTNATRSNTTVMFVRRQDQNGEADVVITNATSPDMLLALYKPMESGTGNDE